MIWFEQGIAIPTIILSVGNVFCNAIVAMVYRVFLLKKKRKKEKKERATLKWKKTIINKNVVEWYNVRSSIICMIIY